jgi:hypothetical protein
MIFVLQLMCIVYGLNYLDSKSIRRENVLRF